MLARVFLSWLQVSLVRQVILVDWSSSPPLRDTIDAIIATNLHSISNITLPDVHIIRVAGEPHWILSRAYNLAASLTKYDTLFKVDCDVSLHLDAILVHALPRNPPSFFAGRDSLARHENELYLSGQFIAPRSLFFEIGGYDERIQTYGYENVDLYQRLEAAGASRLNLSYDYLSHILHHQTTRSQAGVLFPSTQGDINGNLLKQINDSWTANHERSQYKWEVAEGTSDAVHATRSPPDLSELVDEHTLASVRASVFSDHLYNEFFIPQAVVESMSQPMRETFLRNLVVNSEYAGLDRVEHPDDAPPIIIIHVQNGIGNRLRVLGSGLAFAAATDREPVVIWERDEQFGAIFSEIFNESSAWFPVIDEFPEPWPFNRLEKEDDRWKRMLYVNYMLDEDVGMKVDDVKDKNIYFKSSAIMNSELTSWETENESLLRLHFIDEILSLANKMFDSINASKLAGVHVRNRSLDDDILGVDDNRKFYYKRDMDLIDKWRAVTKVSHFIPTMRKFLKNGTVESFFVASDSIDVCKQLKSTFGDDVINFIDRDCDDRGAICLRYAVADILVLAKTNPFLGSTWSSFTEAAMRLGGPKALMAGLLLLF